MAQANGGGVSPTGEEVALALPHMTRPNDSGGAGLPRPLAPSQEAQLRRIFAMQARGDIPAAVRATARLDNTQPIMDAMLGHVLADRFLVRRVRSSDDELRSWLERYADLPDALEIRRRLVVRMPDGQLVPPLAMPPPAGETAIRAGELDDAGITLKRDAALDRAVWHGARAAGGPGVEKVLRKAGALDPAYAAQLRGEAARILFTLNLDGEAYAVAAAGVPHRHGPAPAALAGYMAGLSAWRMDRFAMARAMFAAAWLSDVTTPDLKAGAAFWAGRAAERLGDSETAARWMHRAAEQPGTFHGLLARRMLGLALSNPRDDGHSRSVVGEADVEALAALPGGERAFALLQLGQTARAAAELRALWPQLRPSRPLARAAMLVAEAAGLAELAEDFAERLAAPDGRPRVGLAVPSLQPAGGFLVDPALIYGLTRAESNFDAALVSSAGARGLMQIMPETASFLTGQTRPRDVRAALHDPATNLDLGQRYIAYLAGSETVCNDLIRLIAAYNTGPGGMAKWIGTVEDHGDPLLFLEAIPIDETRAHVPRVLTYSWLYAARMHLPTPGLDELAAGRWPRYRGLLEITQTGPAMPSVAVH